MSKKRPAKNQIVIYGSYGYTGQLISEIASRSTLNIVLSGRNRLKLKNQSDNLGLQFLPASLDQAKDLDRILHNALLVIHCAGPFHQTWKPMLDACIRNECHYLDITGEIGVFEGIKSRDREIRDAGIMAMPGTGFDVVPTDCLALHLKTKLPDAVSLELAFMGLGGGVSHGTAQTMADHLGEGGAIRENGKIKKVPAAFKVKEINFGRGIKTAVSIPWGDLSTAHFTTGIPNITVYTAMKRSALRMLKLSNIFAPVLRLKPVRNLIKRWVSNNVNGPDKKAREEGLSLIWGRVENKTGKYITAGLITPEGYKLTAEATWRIAQKVAEGYIKTGYQTPASVFGDEFILEIEGTEFIEPE